MGDGIESMSDAAAAGGGQTLRERFNRVMHFEKPDRLPFFEFGYWAECLSVWHEQGLPREIDDEAKAYDYFGIEDFESAPVNQHLLPVGRRETLEETDEYIIERDEIGIVSRMKKEGHRSIPHFIDFPIKTRDDWQWFKERLDPDTPGRIPEDFDETVKKLNASDSPVRLGIGSLCGNPRNWMGFENYSIATLVDQEFITEIMETITRLTVACLERAFEAGLKVDCGHGWEDITFNSGPIIHPDLFYREAVPRYERMCDVFRRNGCDVVYIDSDGNVNKLVEGWLDAGVNCMFPLEVNGGSDPVALRERFGHDILLMGGVDKMRLGEDRKSIEACLKRLLPVVEDGGFIPHVDHRVPPTVSYENYLFYLDLKRDMFNCGKKEPKYR